MSDKIFTPRGLLADGMHQLGDVVVNRNHGGWWL